VKGTDFIFLQITPHTIIYAWGLRTSSKLTEDKSKIDWKSWKWVTPKRVRNHPINRQLWNKKNKNKFN